jgi:hypothetical protein
MESKAGKAPRKALRAGGGKAPERPLNVDQVASRPQDPQHLIDEELAVRLGDEVEHLAREGERARFSLLERRTTLRVEADFGGGPVDRLGRAIHPANPGGRELAGEKENLLALAAFDHESTLGRRNM